VAGRLLLGPALIGPLLPWAEVFLPPNHGVIRVRPGVLRVAGTLSYLSTGHAGRAGPGPLHDVVRLGGSAMVLPSHAPTAARSTATSASRKFLIRIMCSLPC
jgi:hypothetical protein